MDVNLFSGKWQLALVYLDNIIEFRKTTNEHLDGIRKVFLLSHRAGITLKLKKRKVFTDTIDSLGPIIRARRLKLASHTRDAIGWLQPLINLTELCSFLGWCIGFQRLVPIFVWIAAPLEQRLKKELRSPFTPLSSNEVYAMKTLKSALISSQILALPNSGRHITLDTDASFVQVGCVLLQKQLDDTAKLMGYWSRFSHQC